MVLWKWLPPVLWRWCRCLSCDLMAGARLLEIARGTDLMVGAWVLEIARGCRWEPWKAGRASHTSSNVYISFSTCLRLMCSLFLIYEDLRYMPLFLLFFRPSFLVFHSQENTEDGLAAPPTSDPTTRLLTPDLFTLPRCRTLSNYRQFLWQNTSSNSWN